MKGSSDTPGTGFTYTDGFGNAFAEVQIKAARDVLDLTMRAAPDLFSCLQGE